MGVKIEISADTAAEAVALGKELFGLVGVTVPVGGVAAEPTTAPKAGRATKKAEEPKPEPAAPAAVDPFAGGEAATTAPAGSAPTTEAPTTSAPPAASETQAPAPAAASAATFSLDQMKSKLTEVLKAKSAGVAQKAILDATGGAHKALTGLPESLYGAVYAKLDEALKG